MGEYLFCIIAATLTPFAVVLITDDHQGIAVASLVGFCAIPCVKAAFTHLDGPGLNRVLGPYRPSAADLQHVIFIRMGVVQPLIISQSDFSPFKIPFITTFHFCR